MTRSGWIPRLALGVATALILAACGGGDEPEGAGGTSPDAPSNGEQVEDGADEARQPTGTLRYGINFSPNTWNNLVLQNETYTALVYEKLVTLEADGVTVVPQLAESWEESADAITFHLREGVTFTDGTPFDADAVVANIERVSTEPGTWDFVFDAVDTVVVVDPLTVRLELARPDQALLQNMARRAGFMVSPAALADGSFTEPVGTGPWRYVPEESQDESFYTFEFYEDYWAPETVGVERVEVLVILENETRVNAVLSGDVDVAGVAVPDLPTLEAAGMETTTWPSLRHGLNFVDTDGLLADPNVRRAICHALDFEPMRIAQYDGQAERHPQRHNPGQIGYVEGLDDYQHDLDAARDYLEAAGNPSLSFSIPSFPPQETAMLIVAQQLREIGIDVSVDALTTPQYFSNYQSGDYPMYFNTSSSEDAGIPGYYNHRWSPTGTANPFGVTHPALDEILERGASAQTLEEQREIWEEFTRTVHEEALACFFYDTPQAAAWDPSRIEGVSGQVWFPSHLRYREIRLVE